MAAWDEFPFLGRVAFLLKSGFMAVEFADHYQPVTEEYPDGDWKFIDALDGLSKGGLAQLPWPLQDEFGRYVETSNFQNWIKKGGEENERQHERKEDCF